MLYIRMGRRMRVVGLDLETSIGSTYHGSQAIDPNNDFYTITYGNSKDGIKVLHNPNGFKRRFPDELFNSYDLIVGHNLSFDLAYAWRDSGLYKFLCRGGTIWDTAQAEYELSGKRHKFSSLGEVQAIHLGHKSKDDRVSKLFKRGIGADVMVQKGDKCPRFWKIYNKYCYDDVESVLKVAQRQWKQAEERGLLNVLRMKMKALVGIIAMQNTGMHIDVIKCEKTLNAFKLKSIEYGIQAEEIVRPMWDVRLGEFNTNSPKQKSAILFGGDFSIFEKEQDGLYKNGNPKYKKVEKIIRIEGFGLPTNLTTPAAKDGQYSTDKGVVEKVYKLTSNEVAKKYCGLQKQAMQCDKMANTYLAAMIREQVDGVLYPSYKTVYTVTGRLSSGEKEDD